MKNTQNLHIEQSTVSISQLSSFTATIVKFYENNFIEEDAPAIFPRSVRDVVIHNNEIIVNPFVLRAETFRSLFVTAWVSIRGAFICPEDNLQFQQLCSVLNNFFFPDFRHARCSNLNNRNLHSQCSVVSVDKNFCYK